MILYPQRERLGRRTILPRPMAEYNAILRESTCNLPSGHAAGGGRWGTKAQCAVVEPTNASDDDIDSAKTYRQRMLLNRAKQTGKPVSDEELNWQPKDVLGHTPEEARRKGAQKGEQPPLDPWGEPMAKSKVKRSVAKPETVAALKAIADTGADDAMEQQATYLMQHEPGIVRAAQRLHGHAKRYEPEFKAAMKGLASSLGIQLGANIEDDVFLNNDTEAVALGPVKDIVRTAIKAAMDYKGDTLKVKDMLRATIAVNSVDAIPEALITLNESMTVEDVKNNMNTPAIGGWRALNVIVRLPSGMLAEVQITTKAMLRAKKAGHKLYNKMRAVAEGTPAHTKLMREQEELYGGAWGSPPSEPLLDIGSYVNRHWPPKKKT